MNDDSDFRSLLVNIIKFVTSHKGIDAELPNHDDLTNKLMSGESLNSTEFLALLIITRIFFKFIKNVELYFESIFEFSRINKPTLQILFPDKEAETVEVLAGRFKRLDNDRVLQPGYYETDPILDFGNPDNLTARTCRRSRIFPLPNLCESVGMEMAHSAIDHASANDSENRFTIIDLCLMGDGGKDEAI